MKRACAWFSVWMAVVFLLLTLYPSISLHHRQPSVWDRPVLCSSELGSTWFRALRAASPACTRSRAGPLEFAASHSGFLITDDASPPWLDYRGPPDPSACKSTFRYSLQGCWPCWRRKPWAEHVSIEIPVPGPKSQTGDFATPFS